MGCAVADEYVGRREFENWREDQKERFEATDKRIDQKVPLDAWNLQNNHFAATLAEQDRDSRERDVAAATASDVRFKKIEDGKANVWTRVLQVAAIVATLAAAWLTAYLASKGAK
jgi:hypothetical protein